ncbi:M16 family metallopeptidase [Planctomyces sp. SH-PL62]|uniref:M16 family metallopeptidase n=1 Tax=Planctomyces sp. SH-PL62 TaxID=1636152 RepID=UPI00078C3FB2|nr:pitrilysin family protein [Planctomyces sp. SH-PL62]AMV36322.1 Protease 3 precursor [Planctomyces sp. SH-PL62]
MARRLKSHSTIAKVGSQPVFERVLGNGLKILVLPRKGVRIVVCDLFYPVGSFDEPPGKSGIAHFLEHMLFKGTERFPKGSIDQMAFVAGGQANADTGEDRTHYWFSLPADRWELALEIEADRMTSARFDPREVEAERQVIGEERARDAESALSRLEQNHQALSYLRHPYRNPVLGWPRDVASITVEDLEAFYRRHYRPDGAVIVFAGDLDPERALDRAEERFGAIPPGSTPRGRPEGDESPQAGRRDFVLAEADALPRGVLGWHTVPSQHPDAPALDVLADVLSAGRRSRLWRSLVEDDHLAGWVEAQHAPGRQGGQFLVQIEATDERIDPDEVEDAVLDILDDLTVRGPSEEEMARVRNRFEAGWRWDQEDILALACGVGEAALWGDWRDWQADHAAALAVDAAAVRRVAGKYLLEDNLTAGWLLRSGTDEVPAPRTPEIRRGTVARTEPAPLIFASDLPATVGRARPKLVDYRPRRFVLANGLRVIHERRADVGVAAVDFYVEGGWVREAAPGAAALTSRMLEEGCEGRTAQEVAAAIEDVGGSLEFSSAWSALRARSEDLALGLEILADVARRPAFPAESLAWTKQRLIAELKSDLEDPAFRADQEFRRLIYGDHPLGRDYRGGLRELRRLTRDDVVAHHRRHFSPENAFLVVVGEFDAARLKRLVEAHFGDWEQGGAAPPTWPALGEVGPPRSRRISCPGEQVHIVMGHRGISRHDADFDALLILDHILGSGPGFSDRLGRIVRDEMGLVYSIGGGATDSADVLPGVFRIYAGTRPEEADRVVAAVSEQIRAMHDGDFSDDEVIRVQRYLTGASLFELQTVEQRAERLVDLERLGLPLDEPRTWPARIAAVTPARVRDAARRRLSPDGLFRVELGPASRTTRRAPGRRR